METGEIVFMVIAIIFFSVITTGFICSSNGIDISQETGDEVCRHLTGNEIAVAYDSWSGSLGSGKLGCKLPSFDETQNIIIEKNNE